MSLSSESKSQTQSPWKVRRKLLNQHTNNTDNTDTVQHDLDDRSYFFYSPSTKDTDKQEALEAQALTLEPQSGHYQDPIVVSTFCCWAMPPCRVSSNFAPSKVCDFTALYPSLVIAYNLCYSTHFGHLNYTSTRIEMQQVGRTTGRIGPFPYSERRTANGLKYHMKSLSEENGKDRAYVAPTGSLFVSESVVKGVLPQVLDEMLSTRAMLKKAAKEYKRLVPDLPPSILRQLEARQLALKYVANVTYGKPRDDHLCLSDMFLISACPFPQDIRPQLFPDDVLCLC
jgi:DNA polymerase zeta